MLKLNKMFNPGMTMPIMYHLGRSTILIQYHQLNTGIQAIADDCPAALNIFDNPTRVRTKQITHRMRNKSELKLCMFGISSQS